MEDHDASGGDKTNENSGGDKTKKQTQTKNRTRGPTTLKKEEDKGPFLLQWDKAGFPTGIYATKFASYCGKKVRCQVNINFDDWDKDVEDSLKDLLWKDISAKYLVNETHKKDVLINCGEKWRDFKGKLTRKYIRNKHPKYDSPADCYSFIEPADWEKFKAYRESDEFKEKSKKAAESIKHNEHPHVMGRRGYNQRIPEWIASSSNSDEVIDRSWYWIKGRTKSTDGEVPNEKIQKVQEEMVYT
ncbi:uncharacterized protein LOC141627242 [Silene latifolia]|uniref:uncharacterized protein LOC141627242 n=1 Tax=Silene latifolia TaxID=37657 RepID=UPI003D7865A2